jgi:hypothetical protein
MNAERFASMATVKGPVEDFEAVVRMAAESLLPWIRQYEGYQGFLVLGDAESGTAHFVTLWENKEALDQSAHGRAQVRERLAKTAGAEIESAGAYGVLLTDGLG